MERYLRRIRLTCFDYLEFSDAILPTLAGRIREKRMTMPSSHHGRPEIRPKHFLSYHFYDHWRRPGWVDYYGDGSQRIFWKGRRIRLTEERRRRWLAARAKREYVSQIIVPQRMISPGVAQQALRELGIITSKRVAVVVMREIVAKQGAARHA